MDVRKPIWHGQLSLTGIGTPSNHSGSVMQILGEILKDLQATNPRALSDGNREIVIRIRDKAYGGAKDNADLERVLDVEAGITLVTEPLTPIDGMTFESYYDWLIEKQVTPATAQFLACDWFDRVVDPELVNWLADQQAIRFRQLNYNNKEFESATPTEYAILKHYVIGKYPNMTAKLVWRVA